MGREIMPDVDSSADPEQLMAALKRKRQVAMLCALAGIVVVLGCLFGAAGAMYAKDPVRELQIEKAALQPASPQ
jgi:hypothetical protein